MRLLAAASAGFVAAAAMAWLLGQPITLRAPRLRWLRARAQRRRQWLAQAGARVTPTQFYGVSAATGAGVFVLVWAATGAWVVALVPAALAAFAPQRYYAIARTRRVAAINQAWPDGLRDLTASISQQQPLHQALVELARAGPAPLRHAFARYATLARTFGTVAALEQIKAELANPVSDRVLEVLILAAERGSGGDLLARLLADLAESVTADLRVDEDIETARLEPRISTAAAAAAPWLLLLVIVATNRPQPIADYYTSGRGLLAVLAAAAMTLAGVALVRALARDPVEPRVFVGEQEAP